MSEVVQPKKGMSKGCMVGLIVGVVIIILIGALVVTCWMKKDELAKFGATTLVNSTKSMVAEDAPEGVDTVEFNKVMDDFVERINTDSLNLEKISTFFQTIQTIPNDKKVDADEVELLYNAIYDYYPDLKPEEAVVNDTTSVAEDTTYEEVIK